MKFKIILIMLLITTMLFTACSKKNNNGGTGGTGGTGGNAATQGADTTTTASIVDTEDAFMKAISSTGTWIIAITKDLTISQDIALEGEFKNGKKDDAGNDIIQRKVALYSQDANRNITARYTLTAPKFTIRSPQASIQHGTFKGDLYVDVDNFQLIDATVDGNVFFTKQAYKDSFTMDGTSSITGTQSVQP